MERAPKRADPAVDALQSAFAGRLRALDQGAWVELYDSHRTQIWRYVYGRTSSRDAADDLTAQVFAEALSSIQRYRHKGRPVLAWLYTIARNLASKHIRRAQKESPGGYVEPSGGAPEEGLDALVLADALGRLTSEQRELIVLRFYSDLSTREIATAMGKREAAIYSLEVRAIAALRRQFAQDGRSFPVEADKNSPAAGIDRVI